MQLHRISHKNGADRQGRVSITLSLLALCVGTVTTTCATDFAAWPYAMPLRFNPAAGAAASSNATVLVRLGPERAGFAYTQFASPEGLDLRFSDASGRQEWPCEIESWDTNGNSFVWLQVPELNPGTEAIAYWGNSAATQPVARTTHAAAWDSAYLGVWHLNADLLDSTRATNDGLRFGCIKVPGLIAGANQFDGVNDYIRLESMPPPNPPPLGASHFTLSAWIYRRGNGDTVRTGTGGFENVVEPIVTKGRGEADGSTLDLNYFLGIRASDRHLVADYEQGADGARPGANGPVTGNTPIPTSTWVHVAATYDGTWRLYVNGKLDGQATYNMPVQNLSIQPAAIGGALDSRAVRDGAFNGLIDEVRIASAALSSNAIHAAWLNVASNALFNGYGAVAFQDPATPYVRAFPTTNVTAHSALLAGDLLSTGSLATVVSLYYGTTDGGTQAGSWSNCFAIGERDVGPFSVLVTGLQDQVVYYFRAYASNAAATAWSPRSESFITGDIVSLVVTGSPYALGICAPFDLGVYTLRTPFPISNRVVSTSVETPDGTRWRPDGWTGSGSVPATGQTADVAFTLHEPSILTWQWAPSHYFLAHPASAGGAVLPDPAWYPAGSVAVVTAAPVTGFRFMHWTGDVDVALHTNLSLAVQMDGPKSIQAVFHTLNTPVSGTLTGAACWTPANSPYVVVGNATVPANRRLCIEPGTEVLFLKNVTLTIAGTVNAVGTALAPIKFRNHPSVADGGSLFLSAASAYSLTATGVFEHCEFTHLGASGSALRAMNADLRMRDCVISNMPGKVIEPQRSRVEFVRNSVSFTGEGINVIHCAGLLASNTISNVQSNADAIDVDFVWEGPGNADMIVEWNILRGSTHSNADAIDIAEAAPLIRHNRIYAFADKGISLGPIAYPVIYNNLIDSCNIGIQIKDSSDPVIANNTLVNCTVYGVHSYEKGQGPGGGGLGSLTNMLIWNCGTSILMEDGSRISVGNSLVPGATNWPGPGNFTNDPLFVAAALADYTPRIGSPCWNAGQNQSWMDGATDLAGNMRLQNGRVDVGCFETTLSTTPRLIGLAPTTATHVFDLLWTSATSCTYTVQFSEHLSPTAQWVNVRTDIPATPPLIVVTNLAQQGPHGFYRILCE